MKVKVLVDRNAIGRVGDIVNATEAEAKDWIKKKLVTPVRAKVEKASKAVKKRKAG